jgi:2',3'-cyclic-nucleotide 2'-phosphodiesterase (5'-nucleotidase family)
MDFDLVVFQLNDRHSHWLGLSNCDYKASASDGTLGGAARWASVVSQARSVSDDVLLLDAGDFTMGTMLVAAENGAADLNMMKRLGFDAAALGNHEFDGGPAALASMINAAESNKVPLLCANMVFSKSSTADDALARLYGPEGQAGANIHPYIVRKMPGGYKVGIFGLMGMDAESVSNAAPVTFSRSMKSMASTAQSVVNTLRHVENVDVVILLAHLGLTKDDKQGETAELARRVVGIDVILSGHKHTQIGQTSIPCEVEGSAWTTVTMEAHSYGRALGRYAMHRRDPTLRISAELLPVDGRMAVDDRVADLVAGLQDDLEQNFLGLYPQTPTAGAFLDGGMLQKLGQSDFDLERHFYENSNLGYLLADTVAEATVAAGKDVQVVVMSNGGDLRADLLRCDDGGFDLSDVFIVCPLGIGFDGRLGYPLMQYYLNWQTLVMMLEVIVVDKGWENNDYMLNLAGLRLHVDSSLPVNQRIVEVIRYDPLDESDVGETIYLRGAKNNGWGTSLFMEMVPIVSSAYIAGFLSDFGLSPLNASGQPVRDLSTLVIRDTQKNELKLWYLLAEKLASFPDGLPDRYNDDAERNPYGAYWRRLCDVNAFSRFGHSCDDIQ